MSPQYSYRRRWLNQSTYSAVASSTVSRVRHGPRGLISSVLYSHLTVSARALSVEAVAHGPDRGRDPSLGQPLGVTDRHVLRPTIRMCHNRIQRGASPLTGPHRLLERVQDQLGRHRRAAPPAQDPAGVGVDHERDVHPPAPGRHVRHVRHPQPVRRRRGEVAAHQVPRPVSRRVGNRGAPRGADVSEGGERPASLGRRSGWVKLAAACSLGTPGVGGSSRDKVRAVRHCRTGRAW
jgi:hypothetical protein